jgi:hypothetical protein
MRARIGEVIWTLDHLHDLEADFLAFYRMAPVDVLALSGPRFLALAYRLPAYSGVMAARMAATETARRPEAQGGTKVVGSSQTALRTDPVMSGLIDF